MKLGGTWILLFLSFLKIKRSRNCISLQIGTYGEFFYRPVSYLCLSIPILLDRFSSVSHIFKKMSKLSNMEIFKFLNSIFIHFFMYYSNIGSLQTFSFVLLPIQKN